MTWNTASTRLARAMVESMGQSVIVRVGLVETELRGIFSFGHRDAGLGGMEFRENDPTIDFATADFAPIGATVRHIVVVEGTEYTLIAEPEPDDGGMTHCVLRRYG